MTDKKDIYSYEIDGKLYINLTNHCTNNCDFCVRHKDTYEGYYLWLKKEPTVEDVISSVDNINKYSEVVFCGYGEPTYRIEAVTKLGRYFKSLGKKTRVNTNGHGNEINGRDISSELVGAIDVVSISLNQSTAEKYQKLCHSQYGDRAFGILLDFAAKCVEKGLDTVLSIVAVKGVDIEECRSVAAKTGARLKIREYIDIDK